MYKKHFPLFEIHPDLVYLDSAATSLTPLSVTEEEARYAREFGTNALRGLYPLAEATDAEVARIRGDIASFIGAQTEEIIFTAGTTHGINLVASGLRQQIPSGTNIVVTSQEHHANFLPWKNLSQEKGLNFRIASSSKSGHIDNASLLSLIDQETALVALTFVSNVSGVINPLRTLIPRIRAQAPEAIIIIDAAQAIAHIPVDVRAFGADVLVFSGHKMYGPTGIGVLWLSAEIQNKLSPGAFGGGMVQDALATPPLYKGTLEKFEAGTQNLSGIFGLGAAVKFLEGIGFEALRKHDQTLLTHAFEALQKSFGEKISFLGSTHPEEKTGVISFTLSGVHPHDIASTLGTKNICVRAGEHCASPLHHELGIAASTRLSFGLYTTTSDIDAFVVALQKAFALYVK
jgi:cysteine desulfurase/selenocysteine lyase